MTVFADTFYFIALLSESDPAHDDGTSADWSSEGGATTEGPATDQDADDTAD